MWPARTSSFLFVRLLRRQPTADEPCIDSNSHEYSGRLLLRLPTSLHAMLAEKARATPPYPFAHDGRPPSLPGQSPNIRADLRSRLCRGSLHGHIQFRSEEHTSELQSPMY